MNEKITYQTPEVELVEIQVTCALLNASQLNGSSVEEANYRNDIGWN